MLPQENRGLSAEEERDERITDNMKQHFDSPVTQINDKFLELFGEMWNKVKDNEELTRPLAG